MKGHNGGLISGTIPAFEWRNWEKLRKTLVRIASQWAKIWTKNLLNTKLECQALGCNVQFQEMKRIIVRMSEPKPRILKFQNHWSVAKDTNILYKICIPY